MSSFPSFNPSLSTSSSAGVRDTGLTSVNAPVSVIAGNGGAVDPVALVNAAAQLSLGLNEPAERALGQSPSVIGGLSPGGTNWLPLVIAGVAIWLILRK